MKSIVERVKNIILKPASIWEEISVEQVSESDLIKNYLGYMVAVPTVAGFLGSLFSGKNFFGSLLWAGVFYVLAIAGAVAIARILNFLATSFKAEANYENYFKLVVYSLTPIFIANIFFIIPPLYGLSIVGIYGFYLFWTGFFKIINCPENEKFNFLIVSLIVFVLILILIYLIPALLFKSAVYDQIV